MPKITLTAGVIGSIPAERDLGSDILYQGQRKSLVFTLISGAASWGWNADVTVSGDDTAGIPMSIGAPVTMMADDLRLTDPVYLLSAAGAVVNWQAQYK